MPLDSRDKGYLWDILDACSDIVNFTKGTTLGEFERDKMKRFAIERQLLVIGEAAHHLSGELKVANPSVPWKSIVALRNIIAHEYGEILVERIYRNAIENVPELSRAVSGIFSDSDESSAILEQQQGNKRDE